MNQEILFKEIQSVIQSMTTLDRVSGVVLVDHNGSILFKNINTSILLPKSIAACAKSLLSINTGQFKYAALMQQDHSSILIFPVQGPTFFGVLVQAADGHNPTSLLAQKIQTLLTDKKLLYGGTVSKRR